MDIFSASALLKELRKELELYCDILGIISDNEDERQNKIIQYIKAIDGTTNFLDAVIERLPTDIIN